MRSANPTKMALPSDTRRPAESAQVTNKEGSPNEKPVNKQKMGPKRSRTRWDTLARKDPMVYFHFVRDIILEILLRLPMEALLRCRCVCKEWYKITKDPSFINRQRTMLSKGPPRFICCPLNRLLTNVDQLFLWNSEEGNTRKMPINESFIRDGEIVFCHDGVLCIAPKKGETQASLVICNPITKEWIRLPRINNAKNLLYSRIGFCFVPARQEHILVQFTFTENILRFGQPQVITGCYILTSGQRSWRLIAHPQFIDCMGPTLFWNNVFYWTVAMSRPGSHTQGILSFNTIQETFQVILLPGDIDIPWHRLYLLVLNDRLTLVGSFKNEIKLWEITGDRVGEFSLVLREAYYNIDTMRFSLLSRLNNKEVLLASLYNNAGSGFVAASNNMKQLRCLHIKGVPYIFKAIAYSPSLVSVHSMGFPGYHFRS